MTTMYGFVIIWHLILIHTTYIYIHFALNTIINLYIHAIDFKFVMINNRASKIDNYLLPFK